MAVSLLLLPRSLIPGIQRSGSSWTMLVTATPTKLQADCEGTQGTPGGPHQYMHSLMRHIKCV